MNMRMPAHVTEDELDCTVVLGPCPGCESWQLDYTHRVAAEFYEPSVEEVYEFSSEEPMLVSSGWDSSAFREAVEHVLREHLEECPHLQAILDQL